MQSFFGYGLQFIPDFGTWCLDFLLTSTYTQNSKELYRNYSIKALGCYLIIGLFKGDLIEQT